MSSGTSGGRYAGYEHLAISMPRLGVLQLVLDRPERLNALDESAHTELVKVWRDIDDDPDTRAVVLTGEGRAFSAGGDFEMLQRTTHSWQARVRGLEATRRLVYNMLDFSKPVVSAINGVAVGAGLAAALLADVSIASHSAQLLDGHSRLGVAAGDHAAMLWPLLIGVAKAKYHLLTGAPMSGEEAERLGLVSLVVDDERLMPTALETAEKLAAGPPVALRMTKLVMNHSLRASSAIFDASAAMEFLCFGGPEAAEGLSAHLEKREPEFPRIAQPHSRQSRPTL